MESCLSVEREVDKILSKFHFIDKHTANSLLEVLGHIESVKRDLGLFEGIVYL